MLRVSAMTTATEISLDGVMGDAEAADGIEHGNDLMKFAEALALRDHSAIARYRAKLLEEAGPEVLVDAAGVAGNFQRMVRIADSIGIPVDDMTSEMGQAVRADLKLEEFASAQNTLGATA